MCIRDRYQRRVHGENQKQPNIEEMNKFIVALLAIVLISTIAEAKKSKTLRSNHKAASVLGNRASTIEQFFNVYYEDVSAETIKRVGEQTSEELGHCIELWIGFYENVNSAAPVRTCFIDYINLITLERSDILADDQEGTASLTRIRDFIEDEERFNVVADAFKSSIEDNKVFNEILSIVRNVQRKATAPKNRVIIHDFIQAIFNNIVDQETEEGLIRDE
eukprot:TRINITY_DN462_c0_g1_i2.p1 TRINITY_DN462_c0_g1~~TRINITY_DN462_c0_g1_i2.p1  ORF type:complete len:220 (+),score=68.48 TRINITY_DN462_c0_g1_i2:128-787(+)